MKLRPKQAWILLPALLVAAGGWFKFSAGRETEARPASASPVDGVPEVESSDKPSAELRGNDAFLAAHKTPIRFYGKVVDQDGAPVLGATVTYIGNSEPWGGAPKETMKSDGKGNFEISSKGLNLYVAVSKENFRTLPTGSNDSPGADDLPKSSASFN